jgi:uncharacterized protein YbbK (DUF523 family)
MQKILVSACFLGLNVRYDGKNNKLLTETLELLKQKNALIAVCPELCGGLSTPRDPAEIQSNGKTVVTINKQNVTQQFIKGAEHALALCKQHNISVALLKESSPSCGSTTIYNGSFTGSKISGEGITTQLLRKHKIAVFSEKSLPNLLQLLKLT